MRKSSIFWPGSPVTAESAGDDRYSPASDHARLNSSFDHPRASLRAHLPICLSADLPTCRSAHLPTCLLFDYDRGVRREAQRICVRREGRSTYRVDLSEPADHSTQANYPASYWKLGEIRHGGARSQREDGHARGRIGGGHREFFHDLAQLPQRFPLRLRHLSNAII
jgi:hypothetical protein